MAPAGRHFVMRIDSSAKNMGTAAKNLDRTTGDHSPVVENFEAGQRLDSVILADGRSIFSQRVADTKICHGRPSQIQRICNERIREYGRSRRAACFRR